MTTIPAGCARVPGAKIELALVMAGLPFSPSETEMLKRNDKPTDQP
jgi:hypothetical protein